MPLSATQLPNHDRECDPLDFLSDNPSKFCRTDQYCDPFQWVSKRQEVGFPTLFQATQSSTSESEIDLFKQAELTLPLSGAKLVRTYATLTRGDGPLATINARTASLRACENRSQNEARANEKRELRKLKTRKRKVVLSNGGPE